MMSDPFPKKGHALVGFLLVLCFPSSIALSEVTDFSYSTLDTRMEGKFRIAFWQDPDLSQLEFSYDSFREKLRRFGREFEETLKGPLIEAGFGDLQISVIDDYESLLEERTLGRFQLLHCDPAAYLRSKNEAWEPYTVLLEEVPREPESSSHAVIWVTRESSYQDPKDLFNTRVAIVDPSSLFGGALQWARLRKSTERPLGTGPGLETVRTGSVSEGILRLVTGLGSEEPIQAAFLPRGGVGFQVAAQMMGLKRIEDLPIRILGEPSSIPLPGNPLLINRYLLEGQPQLEAELVKFFESHKLPWVWRKSGEDRYLPLFEHLTPLRSIERDSP